MPRKLSAILYADVAGYSRLTGDNEDATHRSLRDHLDLIASSIEEHHGQVMHYAGDAVLARFSSVVEALSSAVDIQKRIHARNVGVPDDRKIEFRIGVNLGDVIEDRGDIYGDGVNVAARLESLADSGGVCISDAVRSAIGNNLPLNYEYMGEQRVKNIQEPVRAYQVRPRSIDKADTTVTRPSEIETPEIPSIAVLPFTNMSGDPEQEYFSDGITEDIITALSKIDGLMVIARNSTFTYKGQAVDMKRVGREQGVRYALEGSVRKAGNRVRVTAQLIDTKNGHHIWAERYDRELVDIFSVQDEIMREIVVALDVQLRQGEQARFWSSGTRNLEAWECVRLSATDALAGVPERKQNAKRLLERALELDPDYAIAWVMLGWIHQYYSDIASGVSNAKDRDAATESMLECARKALEADPNCADAYSLMAYYHREMNDFVQAIECTEKAIALAPNNAENLTTAAGTMTKAGKPERGLELIKRAMRVCPIYRAGFLRALAGAHRFAGNPEAAVDAYKESIRREPAFLSAHVNLASTLGELGRIDEARQAANDVLRLAPDFSVREYMSGLSYRYKSDASRVEDGLRNAGLPG
ncbi:adenylate/guanylate cyclase domain-containing protein [Pseudomonadota bacterium]